MATHVRSCEATKMDSPLYPKIGSEFTDRRRIKPINQSYCDLLHVIDDVIARVRDNTLRHVESLTIPEYDW